MLILCITWEGKRKSGPSMETGGKSATTDWLLSEGMYSLNVLSNLRWNVLPNWNYSSPLKSLPLGSVGKSSRWCKGYEANHKIKPWNTAVLKKVRKKNGEIDTSFNDASKLIHLLARRWTFRDGLGNGPLKCSVLKKLKC